MKEYKSYFLCVKHCYTSSLLYNGWLLALFGFFVPLEYFLLIWIRHNYRWKAANFDLCSAPMAIEQWGFFSGPRLLWRGHPFIKVISEDPWHSHLLLSVWQWSCRYINRSVTSGIRKPNLPLAGRTLQPIAPPLRLFYLIVLSDAILLKKNQWHH